MSDSLNGMISKRSFEVKIDDYSLKALALEHKQNPHTSPTIVFLHDSLGCITLWRDFPEQIAIHTGCNAVVYDRRGYGQSSDFSDEKRTKSYLEKEADILKKFLEECEIDNAILFGHSDGGSIALIAAAKYPDYISGIITEGAHVFVEEVTLEGIKEAVKLYQNTDLKQKLEKYHGNKTQKVFEAWTETWLSKDYKDWNITHFLGGIHCPSLIIQGKGDEYGTDEQVHTIIGKIRQQATPLLIPEIGHTPHREARETTLQASLDFIRSVIDRV